jgi:hypothetical protein
MLAATAHHHRKVGMPVLTDALQCCPSELPAVQQQSWIISGGMTM